MAKINGGIKCRKSLKVGCIFCGDRINVGQIYSIYNDENHKKGNKVHRSCAFKHLQLDDPLLK